MGYQVHFPLMVKLISAGLAERLVIVGPKRGKAKLPFKVPAGSHRIGPPERQTSPQAPTVITVLVPDIADVVTAGKNRETHKPDRESSHETNSGHREELSGSGI